MKIYLDACYIIYLLEGTEEFQKKAKENFLKYVAENSIVCCSQLSKLECLVKPTRDKEDETIKLYQSFFSSTGFQFIPISEEVIDTATALRATYNFKTPDSIHLASAISVNADIFLTGDGKLKACSEIKVDSLE
ncbi:MAG: type II toxin-antitoxin system VapC family toxin [Leptospiraceae bacterium]|nr:type II toxin-antitoxin system VapC family toxin [Leptospiraceae bacterium]